MVSKEPIESIYTKNNIIAKNSLYDLYEANINLNNFNYDMLYAYTQVGGITLNKRTLEAEKFAQKLSEKNLDNQTIRTILETQNIKLPQSSAAFIEAAASINADYFNKHHNLLLYIDHPNLVTIYDANNNENYIYAASEPLTNKISTEKLFETFSQEGKINLIIQVSRAVACLHSNKILHLNICPDNIFALLQEGGICQIKLLAAGLIPSIDNALEMGGGSEFKSVFAFMSPEYLSGNDLGKTSYEEDLYALGCLLYFYLSGQRPWHNSRTLFDILEECKAGNIALPEAAFENIPENLKAVIHKATNRNIDKRYSNVAEFIEDLELCRDGGIPLALTLLKNELQDSVNTVNDDNIENETNKTENIDNIKQNIESDSLQKLNSLAEQSIPHKNLTESDLPQPFNEPEVLNIDNISPNLSKTSSGVWKKILAGALVLGFIGGGYTYLNNKKNTDTDNTNSETLNSTGQLNEISLNLNDQNNNIEPETNNKTEEATAEIITENITDENNKNDIIAIEQTEVTESSAEDNFDIPPVTKKETEEIIETTPEIDPEIEKQKVLDENYLTAINNGNKAMQEKNYAFAIIEFNNAVNLKNLPEALSLLQTAKIKQQELTDFENHLKKARELLDHNNLEEAQITILNAKNISGYNEDPRTEEILTEIKRVQFETTLDEGNRLLAEENYQDAVVKFAWALSIEGFENHPDALNGKKIAEETIIKIEKQKAEEEAIKRNRLAQYNAAIAEAEKMLAQKRWDEAVAAYDIALNVPDYTNNAQALAGKQNALAAKLEEERLAIELKKQKLQEQYDIYIKNAKTYLDAGLWVEAEKEFSNALEVEGFAQSDEAADGRKSALESNRLKINREQYDALLLKGMQDIAAKDYASAEKSFRDALLIPDFDNAELAKQGITFTENLSRIVSRAEKYNSYIDSGKENLQNKNPTEAAKDFGRAIVEAPNQINAYILRGSAYLEAEDPERAIGNFNQALEIKPDFEAAQIGKAIAFFKNNDYQKALSAFSEIDNSTQNNIVKAESEATIGWLYLENINKDDIFAPDNQKAYEYFLKAGNLENNVAWNNLGYMLMYGIETERDYEGAVRYFNRAAETNQPESLFNLGMAYYKGRGVKKDYETAFKYFKQAAETNTLPIAYGQLAEMYRRGRGVDKDRDLSNEYALKFDNQTNKETEYLIAKPKIVIPLPEEHLSTSVDSSEIEKLYTAINNYANQLIIDKDFAAAAQAYKLAGYLDGYTDSSELNRLISETEEKQNQKIITVREMIITPSSSVIEEQEIVSEIVEETSDNEKTSPQETNTELDRILNSIELASENISSTDNNTETDDSDFNSTSADSTETDTPAAPAKESKFTPQYNKLIQEAEKMLSIQSWELAEQAFRLALALPDSPDQGDAATGLKTAITEKKKAYASGKITTSDNIAILSNATTLLRDKQWPQAIYLYNSILDSDIGTIAAIGKEVAEQVSTAEDSAEELPDIGTPNDTRDSASYNMAIKQSKQFLADSNYTAAIQMLEIVLNMKGYEDDAVAGAMLKTAQKMQLEHDNSPEALALKRQKNKPIFDKLIKSGDVYASAGNYQGALDSYNLALKIPGYADDSDTLETIQKIKIQMSKPPVSPEAKAEYNALMQQGREALEQQNWIRAEETFRVILSLDDFREDNDAMAGLKAAADAQNKPMPEIGSVDEDVLQNGLIPADADLNEVRRRAEFEALLREGKRQMELMQYEVAEAMFNEALKIEGYTDNRDAIKLLQETVSLKPKQKEVTLPEHPEEEINPEQDMQHQADLLLEEGNRLRAQNKLQEAIQAYTSGLDLNKKNLQLYINRADTNAGLGNFDLALNDYNKVLEYENSDNKMKSYAWNNIANVYYYGKKDYSSAVEFYSKAAEAGNPAAMNSLGVCYGFGKGVEKDPLISLKWYTQAAENDYANAMLNLGLMYQNGWGIASDMSKALYWYEKAAERNIPRAYIRLSLMYQNGNGVEIDQLKAEEYKKQARELGYTEDR